MGEDWYAHRARKATVPTVEPAAKKRAQRNLAPKPYHGARFYPVPVSAVADERLTWRDRCVAGVVALAAKYGEPLSYTEIARALGMDRSDGIKSVTRLVELGHFTVVENEGGRTYRVGGKTPPTKQASGGRITTHSGGDITTHLPGKTPPTVGGNTPPTTPLQAMSHKAAKAPQTLKDLRKTKIEEEPEPTTELSDSSSTNRSELRTRYQKRIIRNPQSEPPIVPLATSPGPTGETNDSTGSWIQRAVKVWAQYGVISYGQAGSLWKPIYVEMLAEAGDDAGIASDRFERTLNVYVQDRKRDGWKFMGAAAFARSWRKYDPAEVVPDPAFEAAIEAIFGRKTHD